MSDCWGRRRCGPPIAPPSVRLSVTSQADSAPLDQPLTVEPALPEAWRDAGVVVQDADGQPVPVREVDGSDGALWPLDVPPTASVWLITRAVDW